MEYFQGDWVLVAREEGDDNSRALILGYYKRRYLAEQDAAEWREARQSMGVDASKWHVWTMRRADY